MFYLSKPFLETKTGSFCRYRKALYFWSLGINLYLELFCFLSFITFVLRNLCSGTHRRNPKTRFRIRDSRYWITDSLSVELGFRISIVIRIPKPWIPESRSKTFPDSKVQIFLHRATLKHFLSFFYTTTKNTKNHLSIQGVTFLVISISRYTVAKKLLMWAFTTLPRIHMRW